MKDELLDVLFQTNFDTLHVYCTIHMILSSVCIHHHACGQFIMLVVAWLQGNRGVCVCVCVLLSAWLRGCSSAQQPQPNRKSPMELQLNPPSKLGVRLGDTYDLGAQKLYSANACEHRPVTLSECGGMGCVIAVRSRFPAINLGATNRDIPVLFLSGTPSPRPAVMQTYNVRSKEYSTGHAQAWASCEPVSDLADRRSPNGRSVERDRTRDRHTNKNVVVGQRRSRVRADRGRVWGTVRFDRSLEKLWAWM